VARIHVTSSRRHTGLRYVPKRPDQGTTSLKRRRETAADPAFASLQVRDHQFPPTALAPARARLTDASYQKLCAALALIFGTESMIVFKDVLGVDEKTARKVKRWAARALVQAALRESVTRR
jgi:hypothetical protein